MLSDGREGPGVGECARLALLGAGGAGGGEIDSAATGESNGDNDRDADREGEGEGDGGAPVVLARLDLGRGAFRGGRGGSGLIGG